MKTEPMQHQVVVRERLREHPKFFALGNEQGTGKTWSILDDAEFQHAEDQIEALFVIAPKGVHMNWVLREIPKHLSVGHVSEFWASGMGKRKKSAIERFLSPEANEHEELVIFAMNIDAVNTKPGLDYARRFLRRYRSMLVIDESHQIKNPSSKRTEKICEQLAPLSASRRIASGTLIADKPLDLFGQYQFLRPGLLGTKSYRAFVAEYSEVLPQNHHLVRHAAKRTYAKALAGLTGDALEAKVTYLLQRSRTRGAQIVASDKNGDPIYKNLEKLGELIAPFTHRVLKKDCLDLPEKVYQTHFYDLPAPHRKLYDTVKKNLRYVRADGELDTYSALTVIMKLRQLASGFIMVEGDVEEPEAFDEAAMKSRLTALRTVIEGGEGPMIIWATFKEEIRQIVRMLAEEGEERVVTYYGDTPSAEREAAVDALQAGEADFFVASPAAGGTGLTLTAAHRVAYYSCSHALVDRLQSEDRNHRIGTTQPVVYTDIVATNTINERIAEVLQRKERDAATVMDALR